MSHPAIDLVEFWLETADLQSKAQKMFDLDLPVPHDHDESELTTEPCRVIEPPGTPCGRIAVEHCLNCSGQFTPLWSAVQRPCPTGIEPPHSTQILAIGFLPSYTEPAT